MCNVVNERLRRAMLKAGHDAESLADAAQVSAKSVERWLSGRTVPYARTRFRVAQLLGDDESYLWPETADRSALAGAEIIAAYPRRSNVPRNIWTDLLRQTERNVDLLAFAGLFLTEEHPDWIPILRDKAENGVRVRLLLGDPHGRQLASRDDEHQIGGGVTGRAQAVLSHYRPVTDVAHIRLHDTPLYNSIYRFDDEMIVNTHVYGLLAAYTPCLHLRRVDGSFFHTYIESFERVWASARPLDDSYFDRKRAS
ncbi:Transcriptional regulator [Frankia sp. Hr75.2]|nr:Transcriptional regulator [Frankia sp. Hr75.2]